MNTPHDRWKQKAQGVLKRYAAGIHKMKDDTLIITHGENVRLQLHDLAEITKAELERRKLPTD